MFFYYTRKIAPSHSCHDVSFNLGSLRKKRPKSKIGADGCDVSLTPSLTSISFSPLVQQVPQQLPKLPEGVGIAELGTMLRTCEMPVCLTQPNACSQTPRPSTAHQFSLSFTTKTLIRSFPTFPSSNLVSNPMTPHVLSKRLWATYVYHSQAIYDTVDTIFRHKYLRIRPNRPMRKI